MSAPVHGEGDRPGPAGAAGADSADPLRQVVDRYAARAARVAAGCDDPYGALRPEVQHLLAERDRGVVRLLRAAGFATLAGCDVAEVGCGDGGNLLALLRLGAEPSRLTALELLPERAAVARARLPAAARVIEGDACAAPLAPGSQRIVAAFTVFSSLADDALQQRLADAMWRWVAPGGGVLWYDFVVDNPRNRDVRGVPLARVLALFPRAAPTARRVTLAPPLARAAARLHPALLPLLNAVPLLRTHRLAWLGKPA